MERMGFRSATRRAADDDHNVRWGERQGESGPQVTEAQWFVSQQRMAGS